jgi:diguanylate cyclase (GGDEF)-like protein
MRERSVDMMNRRDSSAAKNLRPMHVVAGAIVMVLVIGVIDYVTGAQVSIAPLYLAPIAVATWFVSLRVGLLICGLSAVVRLQDLWLITHRFSHPLIPYWNGIVEMGFFVVVTLILSRLRSSTQRWAILARTDSLTGVLNRRAFIETAEREVARAERYHRSLSLAYLDIDDFKKVNDEGGHDDGDRLLVAVAEILTRNLRAFDVVARYGGDEFVLLLPETGEVAADMVLDKLMVALRAIVQGRWPASFSIGAVTIDGPRTSLDRLVQQADKLVYAAKQDGKDCVRHRHLHRSGTSDVEATPMPEPANRSRLHSAQSRTLAGER